MDDNYTLNGQQFQSIPTKAKNCAHFVMPILLSLFFFVYFDFMSVFVMWCGVCTHWRSAIAMPHTDLLVVRIELSRMLYALICAAHKLNTNGQRDTRLYANG